MFSSAISFKIFKVIIMILAVLLQASVAFFFPGMLTTFFPHPKRYFHLSENNSANVAKISHYSQKFQVMIFFISTPYFLVISYISEVSYGSSEQIFVRNVAFREVTEGVP